MWIILLITPAFAQFVMPTPGMSEYFPVNAAGPARVYGYYNNGCIQGAKPFETSTNVWEAMNNTRNHQYGHPDLYDFATKLGTKSIGNGWGKLAIGDSSCPLGGKMHKGHNSHQNGLDLDIFFRTITNGESFTPEKRNSWDDSAQTAVELARYEQPYEEENKPVVWETTPYLHANAKFLHLIKEAAADPRVQRILVSPPIKEAMCKAFPEASWLNKVRPEYGHRSHMHVRLRCPADSPQCVKQDEVPQSLGCSEADLAIWKKPAKRPEKKDPPPPKIPPAECDKLRTDNPVHRLDAENLCLTNPDGGLRCRDYRNAKDVNRAKPAAAPTSTR